MSIPLPTALRVWLRIGLLSFGGPAAQIAVMHRIVVDELAWVEEDRFLRALNLCMLLPGPEAMQLVTWLGYSLHGPLGGLAAGALFVLPGALVMLGLSAAVALWQSVPWVGGLLWGVQAAVLAVVAEALLRVGKRALKGPLSRWIALGAFLALFLFGLPFPVVVLAAGLIGARWLRRAPTSAGPVPGGTLAQSARTLGVGLSLWAAPVAGLAAALGPQHILVQLGLYFSKVAVLTFGGAYSVLAWLAQHVVQDLGWISTSQMMTGLGLAETTPGPLILVVQYVGFLTAYARPEPFSPMVAGLLGSGIVLWVTFVPCYLWIFLSAPWMERLGQSPRLSGALAGITAGVVGVIANLAVWFGLHVIFRVVRSWDLGPLHLPLPSDLNLPALVLAVAAGVALLRLHLGLIPVLAGAAVLGAAWAFV